MAPGRARAGRREGAGQPPRAAERLPPARRGDCGASPGCAAAPLPPRAAARKEKTSKRGASAAAFAVA